MGIRGCELNRRWLPLSHGFSEILRREIQPVASPLENGLTPRREDAKGKEHRLGDEQSGRFARLRFAAV
jgi:hypothetical protein